MNHKVKVIAIYLPQFHETKSNSEWWGDGFTEWNAVQSAESYFPGHNQPRIPIKGHYYNLLEKDTMLMQARLAEEFNVYGFCFYHYYFSKNRMELETPAENLLKWKDVPMRFCFHWANVSWIRSWSKLSGNTWFDRYDKTSNKSDGILIEQEYGNEADWNAHFQYLLPFFLDDRYIKKDGKPVFIILSPKATSVMKDMLACWNDAARKAGMPGLYLIGSGLRVNDGVYDAAFLHEPQTTFDALAMSDKVSFCNGIRCFDYEEFCREMLRVKVRKDIKTYFYAVPSYDDTPRRGHNGDILKDSSPSAFKKYFKQVLKNSQYLDNEYVFVNAWNEWSEGMYIEPDEQYQYGYLKAIKEAVDEYETDVGSPIVNVMTDKDLLLEMEKSRVILGKIQQLTDLWLFLEQRKKVNFRKLLKKRNIHSVAIYGMASLGKHLLIQLRKESVDVTFGIDWKVKEFSAEFRILRPIEDWDEVDAIIITTYAPERVVPCIKNKFDGEILFLENLLHEMK